MIKDNSERMSVEDVLKKHKSRIESQMNSFSESKAYSKFKEESFLEYSPYEKWCNSLGNIIKIKPSKKDQEKLKKSISQGHLSIEPWQALSLSVTSFILVFFLGLILSVAITFIRGQGFGSFPLLLFFLTTMFSIFLFYFLNAYPERLAVRWRLKASSQMVPAILYIVVYMRHTPNLEKAIAFAAEHLQRPLSLDFRRIFYSVEVGKFSTIKESLDNYLETWKDSSPEFIEAFHLIESSLFEPDNSRRISTLEKALKVVLDGVYDKMLKFSHEVRSPLTNIYMLGVVLPTLGLALIPLASAMLGDMITFVHVFVLFNLIIPFLVFYLTDKILLMRPGGYGETDLLERNKYYSDYKKKTHFRKAFLLALPFLIIGIIPLLFQYTPLPDALGVAQDFSFGELGLGGNFQNEMFFGFRTEAGQTKGPFGIGALFLGMFFSLGVAMIFFVSYSSKSKKLIKERKKTKELEREFNNSLFQLGNRLGNGVPPELVFGKVAQSTKGLRTNDFFRRVNYNIQQMGLSVEKAIFDRRRGAISFYPSDMIATTMRILIESSKKGLRIAAVSLMSISEYIKNISKINLRLKDLLAEVSSDMKSNMTFLAPLLSGIVVGLASLITSILGRLEVVEGSGKGIAGANLEGVIGSGGIFQGAQMIPPYLLQICVGIYLIQIIFILTNTLVTVDSGEDKLERIYKTGLNLKKGIGLYILTALIATVILFILSVVVLSGLG
jgi:Flp pilus assembly protein TadB